MTEALLAVSILIVILLALLLLKSFSRQSADLSPQLIDLRNQLESLKTKQLENQNQSLSQQQELLIKTQTEIRQQLGQIMQSVNTTLSSSQGNINSQLKASNEVIGEIQKKLGNLEATTKNIQDISKDISSLQEILQAPKLRGNLGEYLLENLLKDILPPNHYQMKYNFKNNTQVDAIIRLGDGIVPVDSKFPLESFERLIQAATDDEKKAAKREFITTVKRRIDEIASKYINPAENTFEFAMMYIPAENVFYETIISDSLTNKEYEIFHYAIEKHVIPVSPNSFYAYLMAIGYGLKGFRIEQQAKQIIGELSKVQQSFSKFYTDFTLLGKHIINAGNKYTDLTKKADRLNDQVNRITGADYELTDESVKIDSFD